MLLLGSIDVYKDTKVQRDIFVYEKQEFWVLNHFNLTILYCAGWHGFLCPRVIDFNATEQHDTFYDIVYQCGCQALLNWGCSWVEKEGYSVFMCVWDTLLSRLYSIWVWTEQGEPSIHQRESVVNRNSERDKVVLILYWTNW